MKRPHATDDTLRESLRSLGYAVPMVVVHSWAGRMRYEIENWVREKNGDFRPNAGVHRFPQILSRFDEAVKKFQNRG